MEFVRIGDKLIDLDRIDAAVRNILALRSEGLSQQEVAARLKIDRTFISRLETIGNIRRGGRIGLIAFPVANGEELQALANRYGIEERLILSNRERWSLVEQSSGMDFFNSVMSLLERFRQCDTVLAFCSPKWNRIAEALLDSQVLATDIAPTPVTGDIYLHPERLETLLQEL
jgi:transcriptional regulator with XRE-family HTH domain